MKTILSSGPGFFAADTWNYDSDVPEKCIRMYLARLEIYDIDTDSEEDDATSFELLVAKAENNPMIAKALLKLGKSIEDNRENLEKMIR